MILMFLLGGCGHTKEGFVVHGTINNQNGNPIYLLYDGKRDSTVILDNKFQFSGKIDIPIEAQIEIAKHSDTPWPLTTDFMLENSHINLYLNYTKTETNSRVRENLRSDSIIGSKSETDLATFHSKLDSTINKEKIDSLKRKGLFTTLKDYIHANPKLKVSGENLETYASFSPHYLSAEDVEQLYALLDTTYQDKAVLDQIQTGIKQMKFMKIGNTIPHFQSNGLSGNVFNAPSDLAPYTLYDFWASWCMPCRQQNPELVKLYQRYKDQGLQMVSISIDEDKEAWKKAVEKDSLTWIQLNDPGYEIANKFYLFQIPITILTDNTGKIMAFDLPLFDYGKKAPNMAGVLDSLLSK